MIVIDTNVASELMKPSPDPVVRDWVRARRGDELYTTSITLAEIRYGIERLPVGRRRDLLKAIADDVFAAFEDQVLPFDAAAAAHYPMIVTRRDRAGLPIDGFDAQIASICHTHDGAGHPQPQGLPGHRDRRDRSMASSLIAVVDLGYSRWDCDHGFSGCRNEERCP